MKRFRARGEAPPGPLRIRQPRKGYRFSVDSLLLADFAAPFCGRTVLDLGTGSGVLLLLLAARCDALRTGVGLEIQEDLWKSARANIAANGFAGRLSAVLCDLRKDVPALPVRSFDLVISNPPYGKIGEGRKSPVVQREIARREAACTMADLVSAAARFLSPGGRLATVYPPHRLPEILSLGASAGIRAEAIRFVHARAGLPPIRVLVAGGRDVGREGPGILPPLVVHSDRGEYHPEVQRMFADIHPGEGGTPAGIDA